MGVKKENYPRKFWEKGKKWFSQAFLSFAGIKKKLLVSKLVIAFDHETPEIATKTDFHECSRNEFSWSAYETSAPDFFFHRTSAYETSFHETSFLRLLTKRVFMTRFLTRALRTLISIGFKNQKVCEDELFWINNQNIGFFSQFFSINHTGIDFSW